MASKEASSYHSASPRQLKLPRYHNIIILEIKCTINAVGLNHPETILPVCSPGKLSSTEPVPGAQKVSDLCL